MTHFNEEFYTDDFDQEMLYYIEANYPITSCSGEWDLTLSYLKYSPFDSINNFWTSDVTNDNYLTKQQFKEKIGMTKNQFSKSDLKDGMRGVTEEGLTFYKVCDKLFHGSGTYFLYLSSYNDDLTHKSLQALNFKRVLDRDHSVLFQREENPTIELTMQELADKLGVDVKHLKIKGE